MEMDQGSRTTDRSFERKVWRARLFGVFEQLWLKLWLVLGVAGAFLLFSYTGIWAYLPTFVHVLLLGAFGLAMAAALVAVARVRWPSRDEAIRRIERASSVPHRPATSYEDTLSAPSSDPATRAIWDAHRARMAALLAKLRSGKPQPRTDRFDPFAVRAALLLGLVGLTGLMGDTVADRVRGAFTFGAAGPHTEARLDAWLTPPTYTGRPPVMLADGAGGVKPRLVSNADGESKPRVPEVPTKSVLIVRVGGSGSNVVLRLSRIAGSGP